MKELKIEFLEKLEFQSRGNSFLIALFGILSLWGSEDDVVQQDRF